MLVTLINVKWQAVPDATGYEILKNDKRVATTGPRARTSRVSIASTGGTVIKVIDLPARLLEQAVSVSQEVEV